MLYMLLVCCAVMNFNCLLILGYYLFGKRVLQYDYKMVLNYRLLNIAFHPQGG